MSGRGHIILGGLLAFVAIWLWMEQVPEWFGPTAAGANVGDRLELAIKWIVVIQLPLIAGIIVVAQQRFWSSTYRDGSAPDTGTSLDINRRYLGNTLEQSVLASIGLLALSVTIPVQYLNYIPALGALFVVGRCCFWVAYHLNPYARAFGIVLTFAPTMGVYVYLVFELVISR